jgi:hypothetical protein
MPDSSSELDVDQNLGGDHADVLQASQAHRAVQPACPFACTVSPYRGPDLPPRSARLKDAHVAASDNCLHERANVRVAPNNHNAQLKMSS